MRVKTLMRTRFSTVSDDTPLNEARLALAREQTDTIPVVRAGALIGLLRACDIDALGPSTVPSLATHDWAWSSSSLTVRAAAIADALTLGPEASVHDAIRLLVSQDLDAVPVVESASIVGMVTTRDLLGVLLDRLDSAHRTGLDRVLVVVDFDEGTAAAVAAGVALARQHRARLTLLHVLQARWRSLLWPGRPREMLDWARREERVGRSRDLVALVPRESGLEVGTLIATGGPGAAIVAEASRLAADLLVVGSRPHRPFLGRDLTNELVERAPCPVLVVRPGSALGTEESVGRAGA